MRTPLPPSANESSISMATRFPPQGPPKVPVIVILLDSSLLLFTVWDQIPGLCRGLFADPGFFPRTLVGYVVCGPSSTNGSPVLVMQLAADGHERLGHPNGLGIGGRTTETTSGMSILEGYAAAIEMIDTFQTTNAEAKELCSYYLLHFAAEKPDGNIHPIWNHSPVLGSLTWETLPSELDKRNINHLMRVVQPSPSFEVFAAVRQFLRRFLPPIDMSGRTQVHVSRTAVNLCHERPSDLHKINGHPPRLLAYLTVPE